MVVGGERRSGRVASRSEAALGTNHHVEVDILGSLEVWVDGEDRAPAGRLRRSILGILALRAGRAVDIETLMDAVWNGSPPPTARASLQMHMTQIRRSLAVEGLITTDEGGYRLNLSEDEVDALRFIALAREGLDHLRERRFAVAAETLASALELWSDPPLRDLAHLEAAHPDMTELTALHQEAGLGHVEARLELSGWTPDVGELERLVESYPMDERAWRLLVIGLYRSSGQGDALEGLRRASRALGEELGIEPGPRLREVEDQVLTQSPALAPPEPPRIDVPGFTTRFVGRVEDLREVSKAVLERRLMTLVGTGGVGKTRLAIEAARRAGPGFPDGVAYVGLEAVEHPALLNAAVADRVAADGAADTSPLDQMIGDRAMLVVLDNCEHLVEAVAALAGRLLSACPALSILATSRVPLGVSGETIRIVEPLALPEIDATMADLAENEAIYFFVEAARRVNPQFDLTPERTRSVVGICRNLAGIPLALELAASQCDVLTTEDVYRRLRASEVPGPIRLRRQSSSRHSIDDVVGSSLALLEEHHKRLFERMAVFTTPVDRHTLSAVCSVPEGPELTETLRQLAHCSLLTADVSDDTARFGQLPPIRQAAARRVPTDEWAALLESHAGHYLGLAARAAAKARTEEESEWFTRLDAAIEEVRNSLEFTRRTDPSRALETSVSLLPYWYGRNHIVEGRHHIRSALEAVGDPSPSQTADALKAEGTLAHAMSDVVDAERMLSKAADIFRDLEDLTSLAKTLNNLGVVAVDAGDLTAARERYTQGREVFESMGDNRGLAATALNLGVVDLQLGDTDSARTWFQTALEGFRQLGDRSEEGHAMERLSHLAHFEGDVDLARSWLFPARRLYEDLGMVDGVARADRLLAELSFEEGEPQAASVFLTRSLEAVNGLDHHPAWTSGLLEAAARLSAALGDYGSAATLVGAASRFRLETRSTRPVMWDASHESFVTELRETAGDGYAALIARGQSMSISEALELASRVCQGARSGVGVG